VGPNRSLQLRNVTVLNAGSLAACLSLGPGARLRAVEADGCTMHEAGRERGGAGRGQMAPTAAAAAAAAVVPSRSFEMQVHAVGAEVHLVGADSAPSAAAPPARCLAHRWSNSGAGTRESGEGSTMSASGGGVGSWAGGSLILSSVSHSSGFWVMWAGVSWRGVVWAGGVWAGVVWYGLVWCGQVWCGVVWCGVVWCGVVRARLVRGPGSLCGLQTWFCRGGCRTNISPSHGSECACKQGEAVQRHLALRERESANGSRHLAGIVWALSSLSKISSAHLSC